MDKMPIIGTLFFGLGILMAIFHRPIATTFCKLGRYAAKSEAKRLKDSITRDMVESLVDLYDESLTPRIMRFLGLVFAVQGLVFLFLPTFLK